MPTNAALFPRSVDSSTRPRNKGFGKFTASGPLGTAYTPFIPGAGGSVQKDMKLKIPRERLDDRRTLAYAWGYLGQLYEARQRYADASNLTRRALFVAQQAAAESLYLWEWQLGRLLRTQGDLDGALASYQRAAKGSPVNSFRKAVFSALRVQ